MSLSKNIYPSLVLVQPRKTRPFITERLLMGRKESNQTNKQTDHIFMEADNGPVTCDIWTCDFRLVMYNLRLWASRNDRWWNTLVSLRIFAHTLVSGYVPVSLDTKKKKNAGKIAPLICFYDKLSYYEI